MPVHPPRLVVTRAGWEFLLVMAGCGWQTTPDTSAMPVKTQPKDRRVTTACERDGLVERNEPGGTL